MIKDWCDLAVKPDFMGKISSKGRNSRNTWPIQLCQVLAQLFLSRMWIGIYNLSRIEDGQVFE